MGPIFREFFRAVFNWIDPAILDAAPLAVIVMTMMPPQPPLPHFKFAACFVAGAARACSISWVGVPVPRDAEATVTPGGPCQRTAEPALRD
jgi:hypothetical protein